MQTIEALLRDPLFVAAALSALAGIALAGLIALAVFAVARRRRRTEMEQAEAGLAELRALQSETAGHIKAVGNMLHAQHSELQRSVNQRLDTVTQHLGQSMQATSKQTTENLHKLQERLAVIDTAQRNITDLASQMTSLHSVLANKQARGAFGQARMEVIIQDGLPKGAYEFQFTLSNRMRPDCAIFFPDQRPLVIDAKFPLEAVTAFREADNEAARLLAAKAVRQSVTAHIGDIANKYLLAGETQDMALMFVPSESVYADLYDHFDDIVQKAYRARVVIVSPSLLMLAIQVVQQIQKDARMRDAADLIHREVGLLMDDLRRLNERVIKLQNHFNQANDDVRQILVSADKIERRGARIRDVDFAEDEGEVIPAPMQLRLGAGE